MTKFALPLLAFLSACTAVPTAAPVTPWPALPTAFAAVADLNHAVSRFPNSSALQQRRLDLALNSGDREVALDAAGRLAAMGAGLPPPVRENLTKLAGAEAASLWPIFEANAAPVGTSSVHATIPTDHKLVEGLIRDPRQGRLYAASVVSRDLLLVDGGSARPVEGLSGIGSLLTGAFDTRSNRLWLVASSVEQTPKEGGSFTGLVEVDPDSLSVVRRIGLPEGAEAGPNDLVITRDGTIYVSDMVTGAIYRCAPGCSSLEIFVAPRTLRSAHA